MTEKQLPCKKTTQDLLMIQDYMEEGKLTLALREAGRLLEEVLKDIYRVVIFYIPYQQRKRIESVENQIGEDKKGISQFTLGEMVRLYIEGRFQNIWTSYTNRDSSLFHGVDLAIIVAKRNQCVHNIKENSEISWCQAELSITMLKTFLVATGYVDDYNIISYKVSQADIQNIWQIRNPQNLVMITANSSRTSTGEYIRPATGIGQVRAIATAVNSLTKAYENINLKNIYLSTDHIQDRIENDVIIFGGAKNNQVTRDFLDHLENVQPANQEGSIIKWLVNSCDKSLEKDYEEFCGEVKNNIVISDYGLIIRANNVFSTDDCTAILLSGSHTYGTMAAAKYFVEKIAADFPLEVKTDMNFSILVKCKMRNEYPLNITAEKWFFWSRGNK